MLLLIMIEKYNLISIKIKFKIEKIELLNKKYQ